MTLGFFNRNRTVVHTSTVAVERGGDALVGEVWTFAMSPYDDVTPAAYIVGDGWADWIALDDLVPVNGTALSATGAALSA